MTDRVFKTGKYAGQTYGDVWKTNPGFFEFMATVGGYWQKVLSELSAGGDDLMECEEEVTEVAEDSPPVELVRAYYKTVPISGFDMSDHIASIYEGIETNSERMAYLRSLETRNKGA